MNEPSTNGANGKDIKGRFAAGNHFGRGNPHAKKVASLRTALLAAIKPADIQKITTKLISQAKSGNMAAIKEILDRTIGKPIEADLIERLELLEAEIANLQKEAIL